MKCAEIKEYLEMYICNDLNPDLKEEIENHLKICRTCAEEYNTTKNTIGEIRSMFEGVKVSTRLDELTTDRKAERYGDAGRKLGRYSMKKLLIAAACVTLLLAVSAFTPILGEITNQIPKLFEKFIGWDTGLEKSLKNGFGQPVEQSQTLNDIKLTVHNVVADENRTVILYTLEYTGNESVSNIAIPSDGIRVTNQWGKIIPMSMSGNTFDKESNKLIGNFETKAINSGDGKLTFSLDKLRLIMDMDGYGFEPVNVDLSEGSLLGIDMPVASRIPFVKSITLKNVRILEGTAEIEYEMELTGSTYTQPQPGLVLRNRNGNEPVQDSSEAGSRDNKFFVKNKYKIDSTDPGGLVLGTRFDNVEKNLEGTWSITFKPDLYKAKTKTLTKAVNKEFSIDGQIFNLKEIRFTPSQTRVIIEKVYENPENFIMINDIYILNGGIKLKQHGYEPGQTGLEFIFDPVLNFDDVEIEIGNYKSMQKTNAVIPLEENGQPVDRIVEIDGHKASMTYKYTEGKTLEVELTSTDKSFIEVNGAYITKGKQKFDKVNIIPTGYSDNPKTLLIFENVTAAQQDLHINAISVIKEADVKIKVN